MGIGLEFIQGWLVYRTYDPLDMLANTIGVALAGPRLSSLESPVMSTLSEQLSDAVQNARNVPREMAEKLLIDVAGLCVAARGPTTWAPRLRMGGFRRLHRIGHSRTLDAAAPPS